MIRDALRAAHILLPDDTAAPGCSRKDIRDLLLGERRPDAFRVAHPESLAQILADGWEAVNQEYLSHWDRPVDPRERAVVVDFCVGHFLRRGG
jgi:hypothetical protein